MKFFQVLIRNHRPHLLVVVWSICKFSSLHGSKDMMSSLRPFLDNYCSECHDEEVSKGNLNIDGLIFNLQDPDNFDRWERIYDRISDHEMPPKKKKIRPEEALLKAFLNDLKEPLVAADLQRKQELGRVNLRRLTRREYEYTLYDLLGVDLPLQVLLPEDPIAHGFETVASGQQLSHHTMKRYLDVADIALRNAFDRILKKEKHYQKTFSAEELTSQKGGGNFRGPQLLENYSVAWPMNLQFYGRMMNTRAPESAWYEITLKDLHAVNPINGVVWGTFKSGACSSNAPLMSMIGIVEATEVKRDVTYRAWVEAGHVFELKVNDNTLKRGKSTGDGGNIDYNGTDNKKDGISGLAISGIDVKLIHPNATVAEVQKKLLGDLAYKDFLAAKGKPEFRDLIKQAIQHFATRAFRRPVSEDQLKPYLDLAFGIEVEEKMPLLIQLYNAYRAILCSPRFLTFIETSNQLDPYAVASRLSYMLWNSLPDEILLEAASKGRLKNPEHLMAQANRMLNDKKSTRFIESFTDQWLSLRDIDATAPDNKMFRHFDSIVQESMLEETRSFFKELIEHDHSIVNVLDSNFNMLNERLVRHYGMKNVEVKVGAGIQKVSSNQQNRGGLVTQGAILKVTANGTSTSPVLRGVWLSEKILGVYIPPPPTNVPAIEPDIRGAVSIRDQLIKHTSDESCASCHHKIDPTGFAFENFDPVGAWRTKYGTGKDALMVDASGTTAEGKSFKGISEWKKIYVDRPHDLAKTFAQQLLTYGTGAEFRFSDRNQIQLIAAAASKQEYGMRSILLAVIASPLFSTK